MTSWDALTLALVCANAVEAINSSRKIACDLGFHFMAGKLLNDAVNCTTPDGFCTVDSYGAIFSEVVCVLLTLT